MAVAISTDMARAATRAEAAAPTATLAAPECFRPFFDVSSPPRFPLLASVRVCACVCVCVSVPGHHTVSLFFYNFLLLFRFLLDACNVFLSVCWRFLLHVQEKIPFYLAFLCPRVSLCMCVSVCYCCFSELYFLSFLFARAISLPWLRLRLLLLLVLLLLTRTTNMAISRWSSLPLCLFSFFPATSCLSCCLCLGRCLGRRRSRVAAAATVACGKSLLPLAGLQPSLSSVRSGLAKSIGRGAALASASVSLPVPVPVSVSVSFSLSGHCQPDGATHKP